MTKAEQTAKQLLDELKIAAAPIPVENIPRRMGVDISYEPVEGDVSGMLFRDNENAVIGVNSSHPHRRQRFTLAHELGHLLLHPGRPIIVDKLVRINMRDERSSLASDVEEIQANQVAAALLMPRELVFNEVRRRLTGRGPVIEESLVGELSDEFDVSLQAMEYRLINLAIRSPR